MRLLRHLAGLSLLAALMPVAGSALVTRLAHAVAAPLRAVMELCEPARSAPPDTPPASAPQAPALGAPQAEQVPPSAAPTSEARPASAARAAAPALLRAARPSKGLRVRAARVLALARAGARPQGQPVQATQQQPAGLQLFGVGALGLGLRDGDVLVSAGGQPVQSAAQVVGVVLAARAARAPEISGLIYRDGEPWSLVVEQPYPTATP